nr:hypothetical protein [Tanacetum cinerariifolium]
MTPPLGFSTSPRIPNVNTNERPPATTTVFTATTPRNTLFVYRASILTDRTPMKPQDSLSKLRLVIPSLGEPLSTLYKEASKRGLRRRTWLFTASNKEKARVSELLPLEVVKSGQLSHHVKGIKKERAKTFDSQQGEKKEKSTTPAEAPILMINQEEACSRNNISKSPTFKGREITFPQLRRAHREGCRASRGDSHTRNHPEYGFMLLETIRRLLVVIGSRLIRASKGRPSNRRGWYVIKPPSRM